jgi:phosphopantothenoylcysteine decarboxylase / phosphopantothenate---cysteine ligase
MSGAPGPPLCLLGVTGSVAAYRAAELVRRLRAEGLAVQVVTTPDAERFVGADLFAALSLRPVLRDGVAGDGTYPHLDASREAAVVCIAPCTAGTLAKLALGLADNVLAQSALASTAPLVLAPAMNVRMWEHPATRANVATLRERGAIFVGPEEGALAEDEWGMGRMSEVADVAAAVLAAAGRRDGPLAGRTVLVTAGGTREPIDAVRFVGNRSSGRMGAALADEAAARGARVTTLAANVAVRPGSGEVVEVETAADLEREARARAAGADVIIAAAAVADFRPAQREAGKRPREGAFDLALEPTDDILAGLARGRRDGQVLVGFAAEHGPDGMARAEEKRVRKAVDLIVFNDVSRNGIGFDAAENEVVILGPGGIKQRVARAPKRAVAAAVLDQVEAILR